MNNWALLRNRKIIDLFIGDNPVQKNLIEEITMPYMSGMQICKFSQKIGYIQKYNEEKLSRWQYMDRLLYYVIENDKISIFFKELLDLKRFEELANNDDYEYGFGSSIQEKYWNIINELFQSINKYLIFDKCYIEYNLQTYQFSLMEFENDVELYTSKIEEIDSAYIRRIANEAYNAIKNKDYESAITKSRTLVEEVLIKGIENKKVKPSENGNINTLYNQFKILYKMHINDDMDIRIKTLLSGFEKILTAISQMRDKNSDSHGVGDKRLELNESIAELFVNSSITFSNFLIYIIEVT